MATADGAAAPLAAEGAREGGAGPTIIDGKAVAATIRVELAAKAAELRATYGKMPGLAVVLVGSRTDSATYVRMKKKACEEVGIDQSASVDLPEDVSEDALVEVVRRLNADPKVHGILIQLPLPAHINEARVLQEISFEKDVDGLHPLNVGLLALRGRTPRFVACTPKGCLELLKRYKVPISGKRAVVLGRSNIVGMPMALLLMEENATVTVCHSRTVDVESHVRAADILVAAIGKALYVKGDWIKPGAVVIDVGMNSLPDASNPKGYRLVGDVDYDAAARVASAITPVPGGVGPMTIAMLLSNTVEGARFAFELEAAAAAPATDGSASGGGRGGAAADDEDRA